MSTPCLPVLLSWFTSHLAHHLYANYAMGASKENLEAAFDHQAAFQRLNISPPDDLSDSNWLDHLDDER